MENRVLEYGKLYSIKELMTTPHCVPTASRLFLSPFIPMPKPELTISQAFDELTMLRVRLLWPLEMEKSKGPLASLVRVSLFAGFEGHELPGLLDIPPLYTVEPPVCCWLSLTSGEGAVGKSRFACDGKWYETPSLASSLISAGSFFFLFERGEPLRLWGPISKGYLNSSCVQLSTLDGIRELPVYSTTAKVEITKKPPNFRPYYQQLGWLGSATAPIVIED